MTPGGIRSQVRPLAPTNEFQPFCIAPAAITALLLAVTASPSLVISVTARVVNSLIQQAT